MTTITIAPVRKSIRVKTKPEHAFRIFTTGLDSWWPKSHGIGKEPRKAVVFEPKLSGRWYELAEDGTETKVGEVLVWEPPHRFVMSWEINASWKPDTNLRSEVEVRFTRDGDATLVELEHRNFENLGAEGGAKMRQDVDGGWPGLLERFKTVAEQ